MQQQQQQQGGAGGGGEDDSQMESMFLRMMELSQGGSDPAGIQAAMFAEMQQRAGRAPGSDGSVPSFAEMMARMKQYAGGEPGPGTGGGQRPPSGPLTANTSGEMRSGDKAVGAKKSDFGRGWLDKKKKPLTTVSPGATAGAPAAESGGRPTSPQQASGQPVSGQRSFGTGWLNRKQAPASQAAAVQAPAVEAAAGAAADAPSATKTTVTGKFPAAMGKMDPPAAAPLGSGLDGNLTASEQSNTASSDTPPRPFGSWSKKPSDGRAINAAAAPVANRFDDKGGSDGGAAGRSDVSSAAGVSLRGTRGTSASCLPAGPLAAAAAACCESCGIGGEGLLRCGRCKTAFFCGPVCQRQGWQRHKGQCKVPV